MNYKRNIAFLLIILIPSVFFGQRFAIISDIHGATVATSEVAVLVKSWHPDFIITSGDNNYASMGNIDGQVGQFYHEFIHPYTGVYGSGDTVNRFFPAMGNHDVESGGIVSFQSYFVLPGIERYYDFVKGNVHFFCLNSNPEEPDGVSDNSNQALWLQHGLQSSTSLYNIVYFHHPAYSSATVHGSTSYMQWSFKQWGATAVFSGHDHVYERFFINDLLYITCGTGGGSLYSITSPIAGSQFYDISDHGAMLVEADTDSISFKFININDSLIDKIAIASVQTGITKENSEQDNLNVNIYPNPASEFIYVKINKVNVPIRITIYDSFGRELFIKNTDLNRSQNLLLKIDVSQLRNGLYLLSVKSENNSEIRKFIIN